MKNRILLSLLVLLFINFSGALAQSGKKIPTSDIDLSDYSIEGISINKRSLTRSRTKARSHYPTFTGTMLTVDQVIDVQSSERVGASIMIGGTWNARGKARDIPNSDKRISMINQSLAKLGMTGKFQFRETLHQDESDIAHTKYQQIHQGVPVWGNELVLHELGNQITLTGRLESFAGDDRVPQLNHEESLVLAHDDLLVNSINVISEEKKRRFELYLEEDMSELIWYRIDESWHLVWHLTTHPNLASRWEYFIDATTGEVLKKYQSLCKLNHSHNDDLFNEPSIGSGQDLNGSSKTVQTWFYQGFHILMDASRRDMFNSFQSVMPNKPVGVILTLDALNTFPGNDGFKVEDLVSQSTTWDNPSAVAAHTNAATAYEYFRTEHGRISINGKGGNIISLINVADEDGKDMDNAFWNGKAIFYGKGNVAFSSLARSVDVAAHELTHGVISTTANLEYQGESGALNESFADVFAALIDRDDWTIGEEVVNPNIFRSGALRDLADPRNGGTKLGDPGYQPDHYDIRFTGRDDNGGVHINSGIPNKAFFLFANSVGKETAEKVYYNVLTNYLTRSSQFVDLRIAVIDASQQMFGSAVAQAAADAFTQVGIIGSDGGTYTQDEVENPGQDFILVTDNDESTLRLIDPQGNELTVDGPLSSFGVNNPPSVSDNGELVVYVGEDKTMRLIQFDWNTGGANLSVLEPNPIWRNLALSKDGERLAAITDTRSDSIFIFDLVGGTFQVFELSNPTTASGANIETGEALFADAMEWDHSGDWLIYDAFNSIPKALTDDDDITYWDIGFMRVWDNASGSYGDGAVSKLFSGLPENVSVANPTFSKNSPYIIAIDEFNNTPGAETAEVLGINIETGDVKTIFQNNQFGFPNFSKDDDILIFNADDTDGNTVVAQIPLASSKIEGAGAASILKGPNKWGVWFGNGVRDLVSHTIDQTLEVNTRISPNPSSGYIQVVADWIDLSAPLQIRIKNVAGQIVGVQNQTYDPTSGLQLNLSPYPPGLYFVDITSGQKRYVAKIVRN